VKASEIKFSNQQEFENWVIINDTVMGGKSRASLLLQDDMLLFAGKLSLLNNGGFASTRRDNATVEWLTAQRISIALIGDGRSYQFRLRTNKVFDGVAYVTNFDTKAGELINIEFETNDFVAQYRGRLVSNAPPLNLADVSQIGFMLADNIPGEFQLRIKSIESTTK